MYQLKKLNLYFILLSDLYCLKLFYYLIIIFNNHILFFYFFVSKLIDYQQLPQSNLIWRISFTLAVLIESNHTK